jgi:hypothetical protein
MVSLASRASSPSKTSAGPLGAGLAVARLCVGPLALAAFFLPWTHGPGALAATRFTGFSLVGFAGRLQALDLTVAEGGLLWGVRLLILGVAVAAAWQIVLAPRHRQHAAYPASGWYIATFAALVLALGAARSGLTVPPLGLGLLALAGLCFAACEAARLARRASTG